MRPQIHAVLSTLLLGACPYEKGHESATTPSDVSTGGPLTTSPLTTGPLTTGPLTTGPLTTGPLTTGPLTNSSTDATTADATTADATTADATTTDATTADTSTSSSSATGSSTGADEQLFPCDLCYCDAKVSYCRHVLAGLLPLSPALEKCPIVPEDEFSSGCVLYPQACGDTPTCDCIPTQNNVCFCSEGMGTFTATCPLP